MKNHRLPHIPDHRTEPHARRLVLLALLLLPLIATSAWGETVYMKNGSTVTTREAYTVEGEMAVLVLTNGTVSKVPLADIDVERTRAANRPGFSSAQVIEGGEAKPLERTPTASRQRQTRSLRDVAAERNLSARQGNQATAIEAAAPVVARAPLANTQVRRYLDSLYSSQQFSPQLFESTGPGTATVRLTTDSEAKVFRGLVSTALALLTSGEKLDQELSVIELEMRSSDGGQAGDFRITRERAEALRSRQITPQDFYIRYVEF